MKKLSYSEEKSITSSITRDATWEDCKTISNGASRTSLKENFENFKEKIKDWLHEKDLLCSCCFDCSSVEDSKLSLSDLFEMQEQENKSKKTISETEKKISATTSISKPIQDDLDSKTLEIVVYFEETKIIGDGFTSASDKDFIKELPTLNRSLFDIPE